jgi:geranylgeranyl transferase type-1 subunit beta
MWPGTNFEDRANDENAKWDPANVPATYFALASLLILHDDMSRVHRKATLQWIRTMQRPDGSFGETLVSGRIEGGQDSRLGYCATGVWYILRGHQSGTIPVEDEGVPDIDVDAHVRCIHEAEVCSPDHLISAPS